MNMLPDKFIFMKVGKHAGEKFDSILLRKRDEYQKTGKIFWGYGGPTCHPTRQVQPFSRQVIELGGRVHLLMETMDSKADPDVVPATEYSEDGIEWKALPSGIVVTGSKYAIVTGDIQATDLELPLHAYAVAHGKSEGRAASDYLQGRVDKACLAVGSALRAVKERTAHISYSAEILDPFAVLLR